MVPLAERPGFGRIKENGIFQLEFMPYFEHDNAHLKRIADFRKKFTELAEWIYNEIFDQTYVYPDILLRDYARLIIERFFVGILGR